MIGANNPGPFVFFKGLGTLTADFLQIPYPVKQRMRNAEIKRRDEEDRQPPQYILQMQAKPGSFVHNLTRVSV